MVSLSQPSPALGLLKGGQHLDRSELGGLMAYTGGTIDGHGVRARELDHSFIGRSFALQLEGYVLYGRIGAIRVFRHHVLVTLADVPGDDLHLFSDQEIFLLPGEEDGQTADQLNGLSGSLARH